MEAAIIIVLLLLGLARLTMYYCTIVLIRSNIILVGFAILNDDDDAF